MSEFQPYQRVQHIYMPSVKGLEKGTCHIFPKLDGANGSIWLSSSDKNTTTVRCASRRFELPHEHNKQGFYEWVQQNATYLEKVLSEWPQGYKIYGEWLVLNVITFYDPDAYKK